MKEYIEILEKMIENANIENADMNDCFGGEHIEAIENLIKGYKELEEKIKEAYREANNVLYFNDNTDYCCALWEILRIINPDLEDYPELKYIEKED